MQLFPLLRFVAFVTLITVLPKLAMAGMIRDTELEIGLQTLAAPLSKAAGYAPGNIAIRIIIDDDYNAFVAGDKIIYLHSGLLLKAQSATEILGVIAHELGHLKAGHVPRRDEALKQASNAGALAAIAGIALAASGVPGDAAMGVLIGGSDQATRKMLQSFRHDESVADEFGLTFLDDAGISSAGLATMMRRMAAQRALPENRQAHYYQTHPGAAERLAAYQDHQNRSPHAARPIAPDKARFMTRLVDKMRAYTEQPRSVLAVPSQLAPENQAYGHAIAYYRRGNLDTALALMDDLTREHPDDPYYHEFRGDILLSMANPVAAATAFEAAINLRPDSPQILLNLGRALIATNDKSKLPRAIEAITATVRSETEWAFAYRQLAIAYGRSDEIARADLNLAIEAVLKDDHPQAIRMAHRVIKQPDVPHDVLSRANDILFRFDKPPQ